MYLFCDVLPHICKISLIFQQQEVDLSAVRSHVTATLACISEYEDSPTPSLSRLEADLSGPLVGLAITVTPEKKRRFSENIQKKYIQALKEHLINRLPHTELLDAFCIFDPSQQNRDNLPRLQVLIQQYCLNDPDDPPFLEEDALRAEWSSFVYHIHISLTLPGNEVISGE